MIYADDRIQKPRPEEPSRQAPEEGGPQKPDIGRPQLPDEPLKRMRRVDPDRAKQYRQRSGQ